MRKIILYFLFLFSILITFTVFAELPGNDNYCKNEGNVWYRVCATFVSETGHKIWDCDTSPLTEKCKA